MLSPINLPGTKPHCVSDTIFVRNGFILFAKEADRILYATDHIDKGLQFFRNSLVLSSFGKHVIMHVLRDSEHLCLKLQLNALSIKCLILPQNTLKNSAGNPNLNSTLRTVPLFHQRIKPRLGLGSLILESL